MVHAPRDEVEDDFTPVTDHLLSQTRLFFPAGFPLGRSRFVCAACKGSGKNRCVFDHADLQTLCDRLRSK